MHSYALLFRDVSYGSRFCQCVIMRFVINFEEQKRGGDTNSISTPAFSQIYAVGDESP